MRIIIDRRRSFALLKQLSWFVGLWAAGVLAVGAIAFALRWVLRAI